MPFRTYQCQTCGECLTTKASLPEHCALAMTPVLTVPTTKFLEKLDADRNKSALVGQEKILKARARAHSRDVEMTDLIENNDLKTAKENGWINSAGVKRKRIDDL